MAIETLMKPLLIETPVEVPGEMLSYGDADETAVVQQCETLPRKASARAITINLTTGGLGIAICSMPWSVAGSSILPSILITACVLLLNAWTIAVLVRAAHKYDVYDLGALVAYVPRIGRPLQVATNTCIWASCFSFLVAFLIVIHDSAFVFLKESWLGSRFVIVSAASAIVLPLCFFDQRVLEKTSSFALAANVYLVILVGALFLEAWHTGTLPENCCLLGATWRGNFGMVSVMFFAVIVQMVVLPMYEELEDRSPQKFDQILVVSFSILFLLFSGFSSMAYLRFGPRVQNDVMFSLPNNPWSTAGRMGIICSLCCVYPIWLYPMISPLKSAAAHVIVPAKISIIAAAWLTALFVPSLGVVSIVDGALCAAIFVAIIPSLVGLTLLDNQAPCNKVMYSALLVLGLVVTAMGLCFTDNYVADLKCYVFA